MDRIEVCDEYVYLGIVMTPSGSFKRAISRLMSKATKSLASWRKSIFSKCNDIKNVKVMCRLFDSLTKPILLYGSEVWFSYEKRMQSCVNIDKLLTDTPRLWECVHTKFCKQTLGVHKQASVIAVRAELGRYPLSINMVRSILTFWKRCNEKSENMPLLRNAVVLQRELDSAGHSTYISAIRAIIKYATNEANVNSFNVETIVDELRIKYYRRATECIKANGKLNVYRSVKLIHRMEPYLTSSLKTERKTAITKLRLSAHNFSVELGRRLHIPKEERTCKMCRKNEIGN